jgi:hypothetical protein
MKRENDILGTEQVTLDGSSDETSLDDLNGNWEDIRDRLAEQPRGELDLSSINRMIEASSRAAQVALFGGPVQIDPNEQNRSTVSRATRGGTVARSFWWGFHLQISHEDVLMIVSALGGAKTLVEAIAPFVPSTIRPFLSLAAIFLEAVKVVLAAIDRGRGVYISMSWFAPGAFVPTSV